MNAIIVTTNEPILMEIDTRGPRSKGLKYSTFEVRRSEVKINAVLQARKTFQHRKMFYEVHISNVSFRFFFIYTQVSNINFY